MPRSKNSNVSKSPFRDIRNPREHSQEPNTTQTEDIRSREEKVSDLTDLFLGDYHIDSDIIHAVLDECNWNVEAATEKLFEVFFTSTSVKPVQSKKKESNGLASIAVSLLVDKSSSNDKNSGSEIKCSLPKSTADYNLASIAGDVNNNSSAINQKQTNNLRPKVSSKENLVQYTTDSSKHSPSESKMFECKSSQHEFYNKNSFGDMAVNREYYEDSRFDNTMPKSSNFNPVKDNLINESNNDQKSSAASSKIKPRFDLSKISVDSTTPSMNHVENDGFDEKKNTSLFYTDKSMDSLFSGGHSPSTSTEWNMFYKQLDLQPVQSEKIYPEISVNELLMSPTKDSDTPTTLSFTNEINTSTRSGISNQSVRNFNLSKSDFKPDVISKLQISKAVSKDLFVKSPPSDNGVVVEKGPVLENKMNTTEVVEQQSLETNILSPEAPAFVPRVLDAKRPMMTRKSPVKQSKASTKTLSSSDKAHMPKKSKDFAHKKQPTVNRNAESTFTSSTPHAQYIDPMDPLGWKEIKSMTSAKSHKSDFKINTKMLSHNRNFKDSDGLADPQMKSGLSNDTHNDKTALVPPFQFNTTPPSNKNKKTVGKRKEKCPNKSNDGDHPIPLSNLDPHTHNMKANPSKTGFPGNRPFSQEFSQTADNFNGSSPSLSFHAAPSLSLPPSLRRKPIVDHQPLTHPLPQRDNSKRNDHANRIVPKGDVTATKESIVSNKVQFVGVKTPVGKLKHYIDKKQPVMFILRGLPGSGKSYLATQLVSECQRFNLQATSLSSDAYFISAGHYNFNADLLSEAHIWNKQRAQQSLKNNQPVIIIDNTNTTMWEMMPYAEMAIISGYDVQVCEPDTQWKNKVPELARRNQHGVAREHIKRMKDRYEHLATEDVLRAATKSLKGKNKLPANYNTSIDQTHKAPVPVSKHKPAHGQVHHLSSNLGNMSSLPGTHPISISGMPGKDAPPTSEPGLTPWIPAMEQRDTTNTKNTKKPGRVEKQSTPREITLDFLSNSIKKALVGIEKTQDDNDKEDLHLHVEKEEGNEPIEGLDEEKEGKGHKCGHTGAECLESKSENLVSGEDAKDVAVPSEIKIEPFGVCGEESESKSEESLNKEEKQAPSTVAEAVPIITGHPLVVSNSPLLPRSKQADNLDCTGESFYSCDSEEDEGSKERVDDGKEEKEQDSSGGKDENESRIVVPKSPETSEQLTCTTGEDVREKDSNPPIVIPVCLNDSPEEDLDSLDSTANSDRHSLINAVNAEEGLVEVSTNNSSRSESEEIAKREMEEEEETATTTTAVTCPQKQSLVLYSDSEDEENDEECNENADTNDKRPCKTSHVGNNESSRNHLSDEPSKAVGADKPLAEESEGRDETVQQDRTEMESTTVPPRIEDGGKGLEGVAVDLDLPEPNVKDECTPDLVEDTADATTSQSKASSLESSLETTEPMTSTYEYDEYSCVRKKKIKKVKPVENTLGPFLEDSLKEKSRTENWSQFFFPDTQNADMPTSPSKIHRQAVKADAGSQCESYYFSMLYRLNSQAFSNQQPIDVSNLDVQVIQASAGLLWEDSDVVVQRPYETTDRSTITDETVNAEKLDLDTLQNCFPEYSRKQLEELMAVCHNNLEWVTNNLMDAPPAIDFAEQEEEEREEDDEFYKEMEGKDENSPREHHTKSKVKSLATLCSRVVQNSQTLDSDDLEQQVIEAGQTRLEEIESFAWVRLHSLSVDHSQTSDTRGAAGFWPDDFNLQSFTGSYGGGLDEFENDSASASVSSKIASSHDVALVDSADSDKYTDQLCRTPERSAFYATNSPPILPLEFIKCLEMNYGPLNADLDELGMVLDDSTARKIFNCLKLHASKKQVQVGANHEKQMREDEAIARALQESENAGRHQSSSSRNSSVPGWTNQTPSWMSQNTASLQPSSISVKETKNKSRAPSRLNSVSETLHSLRGSWPKKVKPFKFHSQMPRKQDYTVWTSKAGPRVSTMQSIMEEEKARKANFKRMLVNNKAVGDVDDLATKIKRSKLSAMFPFLPPDLLEEIFMNNGYSLDLTVQCLEFQYDHVPVHVAPEPSQEEGSITFKRRKAVSDAELYQNEYENFDNVSYDDLRKEAQFYHELANECRNTAHRHHREGMHNVAFFYRQKVKTYLAEKDEANQRAAELLFSKGSERLLRENTLDLHSYHISEAIQAVNLALHIKKEECKNNTSRKRGHLTIITGRGLHSKFGIPRLKPAIITHLNNKSIRFEETAPGMLKVHMFQE